MYPLHVFAYMSGRQDAASTQLQIKEALKGLCGSSSLEVRVNIFSGGICFLWQNYLDREVPEIKRRLLECDSINPQTLQITELVVKNY